ncbi:MAG: 50S ribosomal protein L24, partial [Clostridia bacterium]|nr:50S ribosomal protein L24 [Clostridia bacterium]
GGIIDKEAAIPACKVMLVCPSCKKATRLAHKFITAEGKKPEKVRVCKKCGATIK